MSSICIFIWICFQFVHNFFYFRPGQKRVIGRSECNSELCIRYDFLPFPGPAEVSWKMLTKATLLIIKDKFMLKENSLLAERMARQESNYRAMELKNDYLQHITRELNIKWPEQDLLSSTMYIIDLPLNLSVSSPPSVTHGATRTIPNTLLFSAYLWIQKWLLK